MKAIFSTDVSISTLKETHASQIQYSKRNRFWLLNGREQYDRFVEPEQGVMEFDGSNISWVVDGQRLKAETINEAITIWLNLGGIEELPPEGPD